MGGRLRRKARRACFVAAAVCLLLSFTASSPAQEEDTVPPPEVFRGAATAQVASVQVDRSALLPVNDLFRFIVLDGSATYESSTRQARASLFFPGNGLILGPNLLCGTFGTAFPPEFKPVLDLCLQYKYPLTVFADDFQPDGTSSGSLALGSPTDPVSGTGVLARAHAAEDSAWTVAEMQALRVLGLPAFGPVLPLVPDLILDTSLLRVDSAISRTNQRIERGSLLVDAEATLSGVRLVGGLVRIGNVRSESHVTDDAKGARTADSIIEVSGVTVAGIPAQITEDGLVVGSSSGALGPLVEQLQTQVNDLLRALGVRISLLEAVESTDVDSSAVASAGGLLIEVAVPVDGLPNVPGPLGDIDPNGTYVASVQLGSTAARGSAFTFAADETSTDGGSVDSGFDSTTAGGDFSIGDLPPIDGTPPTPEPVDPGEGPDGPVGLISDIFDDRLGLLYLALMFAALGLCIVPRLIVPARLPGPST